MACKGVIGVHIRLEKNRIEGLYPFRYSTISISALFAGACVADHVSGAAAYHGDGEPDPRDGADPAADFARRLVDALHDDRLRDDPERQPPERRTVARPAEKRNVVRKIGENR